MESEGHPLDDLARAILEGRPVDWASAESSSSEAEREVVRQLKIVAGIAALHRDVSFDISSARPANELTGEQVKRWGRLNLLERIGRGSFGEVYRAWDTKLDRQVALKLLHAHDSQAGEAASRILAEARLMARVRHPNVVTVFDADEIDGCVGLWMEFIDGRNLEEILREKKSLAVNEVTLIALDLCRALEAVHRAGLIHRDIKCQNLMRADDGRLVLMDFGTGRELGERTEAAIDAAGTPLYLAPEIFRGQPATARSDIYSAGVVLFHLLTGTYPVLGATATDLGKSHARGDRVDLETALWKVDRSIAAIIHRALQIDPAKRFESAQEMLAALERTRPDAEERRRVRHRLVLAAVAAIAVPLVVTAGLIYRGTPRDPQSTGGGATIGTTPEMRAVQAPDAMLLGLPSPDGRFLPFSEMGTGNLSLYEFATRQSRTLTRSGDGENNYAEESIVSEDDTRIAYNWAEAACGCTQLRVIDAAGGSEQVLYGAKDLKDILPLAWSSDNQRILGTRRSQEEDTEILWVSVPSGSVRVVKTLSQQPWGVSLSPDDRYIAYGLVGPSRGMDSDIHVLTADGSWDYPLVAGPTDDSHPMWTGDGGGFLFASKRTGADGLWLQRTRDGRPEGQPQLVNKDVGRFQPIALTRRGALFYRLRTGGFDVYTATIEPDTGVVIGETANGAASFLGSNISPDWSPDSRNLAYSSWRTLYGVGQRVLVLRSLESGKERDIKLDLDALTQPRWSPDGRFIFARGPDRRGVGGLRLIDIESVSIVRNLLEQSGEVPLFGDLAWSPEGKSAYVMYLKGIWRISVPEGVLEHMYQPPEDSFMRPGIRISPDGRLVAFVLARSPAGGAGPVRNTLCFVSITGGPAHEIFETRQPDIIDVAGWTRAGTRILFTRPAQKKLFKELWAVPVSGGPPTSLGLSMHSMRDVRVSPDGTHIAFSSGFPSLEMWVLENFLPW